MITSGKAPFCPPLENACNTKHAYGVLCNMLVQKCELGFFQNELALLVVLISAKHCYNTYVTVCSDAFLILSVAWELTLSS